eukprot:CAMPEP_0114577618 /NCGR_PEP_ID=MMETSP0125-20121206/2259_1 /TAXON_ID=485358 ORGANISM="Aristerostoma sp., Strain ATCC 50986" /NCGR_SAMPLE_ID=MMETSP0125 /ASSEMBLY_ACC=CAM_ASM_000245 /LENGTH=156 /DNA_ID=CAMNT_0001767071 /DNA_START=92 /DNA_END=562 /DNA_ORIENTATION=+
MNGMVSPRNNTNNQCSSNANDNPNGQRQPSLGRKNSINTDIFGRLKLLNVDFAEAFEYAFLSQQRIVGVAVETLQLVKKLTNSLIESSPAMDTSRIDSDSEQLSPRALMLPKSHMGYIPPAKGPETLNNSITTTSLNPEKLRPVKIETSALIANAK